MGHAPTSSTTHGPHKEARPSILPSRPFHPWPLPPPPPPPRLSATPASRGTTPHPLGSPSHPLPSQPLGAPQGPPTAQPGPRWAEGSLGPRLQAPRGPA
ncbi:hypothetical protein G4228_006858 [Cervus hanglu yarkandensis]|nr:hypothetical protein G4228_006858 [Cervus hanglu yarkandensis]